MAGPLAVILVVVLVLPVLFLAAGAMVCAALGVTLSDDFPPATRGIEAESGGSPR